MTNALNKFRALRGFFRNYNVFNYAAQLAYNLMLALLPMMMVFSWGVQFLSTRADISVEVTGFIKEYLPDTLSNFIAPMLEHPSVDFKFSLGYIIGNIALLFFIVYAALRLVRSIKIIFTELCDMTEDRSFIRIWLVTVRDFLILLALVVVTVYIYVEARIVLVNFLNTFIDAQVAHEAEIFWNRLLNVYIAVVLTLTLNWILAKFPADHFKYWHALPGTVFTIIGWELVSIFINYTNAYLTQRGGSALVSGGFSLTVTVYALSLILVLGEILNYYLERTGLFDKYLKKLKSKLRKKDV